MIIRVLQATIAPRRSADFHTFVIEQGVPRFREHDGLIDVYVGLRSEGAEDVGISSACGETGMPSRPLLGPIRSGRIC